MMGIKETPINVRTYYKLFISSAKKKAEITRDMLSANREELGKLNKIINNNLQNYLNNFNIDLLKYEEFILNKYIDGRFLKMCNGAYLNKGNNYELTSDLYELLKYAKRQKEIYELEQDLNKFNRMSILTLKDYTEILRVYYTQVHKELILNGNGYAFGNNIGWICVNRCRITGNKKTLDYAATKKREEELRRQGKRIYNQEEADWCTRNGIEYKAEDKRVFRDDEYCYEIPLLGCKLPNAHKLKLKISDYRHSSIRGKTNENLIEECNEDTEKICNLQIDLKTKLTLCNKVDKILYTKFIRNEAQKSVATSKANS